ncbi:MAG: NUDIX hydrolase [candidate division CPR2 bacterium GW2011_GWC1_41_48]|uniref:NUDIX hydrolase n=1 Tax=candidate division CPR2 bacterium GW2011_GWC1_41_48 TaxID=1618344 RepID=A0A0G0Z7N5_UNCC2|nr:MAG: NUDIX hydrolase [candidate division CPR2 bacterium GW2011_GWC2_39_35]KKR28804.1 MAG: NUDIX hydrolase [candidate division CPR2 bacterium GW2011_GWD2_39_7]KKS09038.1 MAG: NUDIX hydrolase [candidate division CPR2 bacterium GW2011_GWC1_41_48]
MTLIDALDSNGNPIGIAKTKQEIHKEGLWHKAAHVWIYNSKEQILLQLRSKCKDSHPGLFDISAAGHVDSGESTETSAIREIKEEIGLNVNKDDLKLIGIRKVSKYHKEIDWQNNEIDYVYLLKFEGKIEELTFPDREVEALKWIPIEELIKELKDPKSLKKYVDHGDYYYFVIEQVRAALEN